MNRKLLAKELCLIAKQVLSGNYRYKYDPEHKNPPKGGGWKQTEKGWSRNNASPEEESHNTEKKFEKIKENGSKHFERIHQLNRKLISDLRRNSIEIEKLEMAKSKAKRSGRQTREIDNALNKERKRQSQLLSRKKFSWAESLRLPKHRQSNIEINVDGLPDKQQKKNCQFAKRLFDQVVDNSLVPKQQLNFSVEKDKSKRSAYYGAKRGIKLTPGTSFGTYLHEMGHWIEDCNPEVENICKEFLSKRTKGEKPQKLNVLSPNSGYQDDEYTLKDNFSNPYCGKIYPDGGSEILSMGIQMLAENPTSFYRNDPEYFGLIVSILRNEFPKKKK